METADEILRKGALGLLYATTALLVVVEIWLLAHVAQEVTGLAWHLWAAFLAMSGVVGLAVGAGQALFGGDAEVDA